MDGSTGVNMTRDLLTFIRMLEAPRGYDDYERRIPIPPPKPLTEMTVGAVMDWQAHVRRAGAPSTAAGGYQIISSTLARLVRMYGISRSARFDAALQDRLARLLIAECRPRAITEHSEYGTCLAGIWAALPLTSGKNRGRSAYHGVAGNRALTTPETVLALLAGDAVPLRRSTKPSKPSQQNETLAFGAVHLDMKDIGSAMRGAAQTNTLTPSIRTWEFDPYASQ